MSSCNTEKASSYHERSYHHHDNVDDDGITEDTDTKEENKARPSLGSLKACEQSLNKSVKNLKMDEKKLMARPSLDAIKTSQRSLFEGSRNLTIENEERELSDIWNSINSSSWPRPTIEVEADVFLPFRGSEETLYGFLAGQMQCGTCWGCCLEMQCLKDADFLLCPTCLTITPLDEDCTRVVGGVGLGMEPEPISTDRQETTNRIPARAA
eukprot:CAMPEP_0118716084 /NCGR_PEP_ID=MMETSP0800-20121206/27291_1 /TAXON_ID=210618 ORGANISM="Striatella unipunctata, Strain CCMP2910" /NCGR_SAMPLE_ID=MMETSP0800 /ASSEMBLY_ACC=CAM_ASM_000638 /LENGTH=210 /DNA_ID=CAMNT_0006622439 /DNA_START=18 /DNA_END=650 /DNA_ORIENTATION=+